MPLCSITHVSHRDAEVMLVLVTHSVHAELEERSQDREATCKSVLRKEPTLPPCHWVWEGNNIPPK